MIWDDHEVLNNWYPTEILTGETPYTERSVALLAARAKRAFMEYTPTRPDPVDPERVYRAVRFGPLVEIFGFDMRTYRGPNTSNRQATLNDESALLGGPQVEWLKRRLKASTATWKIIASDMPLGLVVPDGPLFEAVANGDAGPPLGRELEIAGLLPFIRDERIRNVVFVTGDVHYCAAHHYDPARASFTDFHPFWEFVAGPAHAGTFGPPPGQDVRARSEVSRHSSRHEAEPAAERRTAVFRDAEGRCEDAGADREAPECCRRHALQNGAAAGGLGNSDMLNAER